jgi:hypothetical protein
VKELILTQKPLFLAKLHQNSDNLLFLTKIHSSEVNSMDLIVCYENKIEQICGTLLSVLTSLPFASKYVDCAISGQIHHVNGNYQIQRQQAVVAVCVLTIEPAICIFTLNLQPLKDGTGGPRPRRLLTANRVVTLTHPAIALSFFDRDHIVCVGTKSQTYKRTCFELDVIKSKDQLNLSVA